MRVLQVQKQDIQFTSAMTPFLFVHFLVILLRDYRKFVLFLAILLRDYRKFVLFLTILLRDYRKFVLFLVILLRDYREQINFETENVNITLGFLLYMVLKTYNQFVNVSNTILDRLRLYPQEMLLQRDYNYKNARML